MKTAAITAEYNPLHNGHKYQLEYLRNVFGATHIAVIMSGSFVQRGGPAVFDKFARAKAAVGAGADLVLQLPYVFSAQTAEIFAGGAIGIIDKCGFDAVCFGCEEIALSRYTKAAKILNEEPDAYKTMLKAELDQGASFAAARLNALAFVCAFDCSFLKTPNNILALEYIRALMRLRCGIEPVFLKRASGKHFKSASALRTAIYAKEDIAAYVPDMYENTFIHCADDYKEILKSQIILSDAARIERTAETEAGLGNRFIKNADTLNDGVEAFAEAVSTKRYTKSRIRRILFNHAMDYTAEDLSFYKSYVPNCIRILAANEKGREMLNALPKEITRITNLSKSMNLLSAEDRRIMLTDVKADDLFDINKRNSKEDMHNKPLIL